MDQAVEYRLVPVQCRVCGIVYGVEANYLRICKQDSKEICCTNGHSAKVLGDNPEADRLARLLEIQEAETEKLRRQQDSPAFSATVISAVEPLLNSTFRNPSNG